MNWGLWADHEPEPEPSPDQETVALAVKFIHREIVSLQDRFGLIDSREISKSLNFGGSSRSFQAVIDLDISHFDTRPLNSAKVVNIADRLRMIDPTYWIAVIRGKTNIFDEEIDE